MYSVSVTEQSVFYNNMKVKWLLLNSIINITLFPSIYIEYPVTTQKPLGTDHVTAIDDEVTPFTDKPLGTLGTPVRGLTV